MCALCWLVVIKLSFFRQFRGGCLNIKANDKQSVHKLCNVNDHKLLNAHKLSGFCLLLLWHKWTRLVMTRVRAEINKSQMKRNELLITINTVTRFMDAAIRGLTITINEYFIESNEEQKTIFCNKIKRFPVYCVGHCWREERQARRIKSEHKIVFLQLLNLYDVLTQASINKANCCTRELRVRRSILEPTELHELSSSNIERVRQGKSDGKSINLNLSRSVAVAFKTKNSFLLEKKYFENICAERGKEKGEWMFSGSKKDKAKESSHNLPPHKCSKTFFFLIQILYSP